MRRGQLSLSVVEAGVGVLLLTAVAAGFVLVDGGAEERTEGQLDTYARDAAVLLTTAGDGGPRLGAALRSERAWTERRDALYDRARALLPDSLRVRLETPRGALGAPLPGGATVGVARVATPAGPVTVRVWYP
jgi:hypothetical protein